MKLKLKKETQLLFDSKPVIFKKNELDKIKDYSKKYLKDYQHKHLFNFFKQDLIENMVYDNESKINVNDFYITDYNNCILFVSNLKSSLTKKKFQYVEDYLKINFYSI